MNKRDKQRKRKLLQDILNLFAKLVDFDPPLCYYNAARRKEREALRRI